MIKTLLEFNHVFIKQDDKPLRFPRPTNHRLSYTALSALTMQISIKKKTQTNHRHFHFYYSGLEAHYSNRYTWYVPGKNKIVERVIRQLDVCAPRRSVGAGPLSSWTCSIATTLCICGNVHMIALTGLQIYSDEESRKLCADCVFSISARWRMVCEKRCLLAVRWESWEFLWCMIYVSVWLDVGGKYRDCVFWGVGNFICEWRLS